MRADLHSHSNCSDGRYSPAEMLEMAAKGGLDLLAITDHDLPPVIPPGRYQIGKRSLRILGGTEISGEHAGRELHLLVYFPGAFPQEVEEFLRSRAAWRAGRFDSAATALELPDRADAEALAGRRSLTRHHLAHLLIQHKRARMLPDAFRLMSPVMEKMDLPFVEVIRRMRAAGGLCVWAHPSLPDAQNFLPDLVAAGLQGMEIDRPTLARNVRNGLKALAARFKLMSSGGSDWHGWKDAPLGCFAVSREFADPILARLDG